jgi:nitroreductase
MDAKQAILGRRSVRKFTDEKVPEELIFELIEAGYNAPSACNKKPLKFFAITNEETLAALNKSSPFSNMPSPLAIVVAGDMSRTLPLKFAKYWEQDAAAATENILIMAHALGLGACWNGVYVQDSVVKKIAEILGVDKKIVPFSLIRIGYAKQTPPAHAGFDEKQVKFIR